MSAVGFISDDACLGHRPPSWHPDSPDRLSSILAVLRKQSWWNRLRELRARRASEEDLARVHTQENIDLLRHMAPGPVDPDTFLSEGSYEAALHAAGAVIEAVAQCRTNGLRRAFCSIRPPGHHAEADRAMGFCLFNNIAVGAAYARSIGFERICIIDFDAHHGNGTQRIFEDEDRVFYFSTHQYPFYPDSGKDGERGTGKGEGFTYNVPVLAGSGDKDYLAVYQDILPGVVRHFDPDLVLVSAGYDIHANDPHANIRVSHEGVRGIVRSILDCSAAPVVFALEGGYDLASLCDSVRITIEEMLRG